MARPANRCRSGSIIHHSHIAFPFNPAPYSFDIPFRGSPVYIYCSWKCNLAAVESAKRKKKNFALQLKSTINDTNLTLRFEEQDPSLNNLTGKLHFNRHFIIAITLR